MVEATILNIDPQCPECLKCKSSPPTYKYLYCLECSEQDKNTNPYEKLKDPYFLCQVCINLDRYDGSCTHRAKTAERCLQIICEKAIKRAIIDAKILEQKFNSMKDLRK